MRIAPSSRMVSPFSIPFSTMCAARAAYSSGLSLPLALPAGSFAFASAGFAPGSALAVASGFAGPGSASDVFSGFFGGSVFATSGFFSASGFGSTFFSGSTFFGGCAAVWDLTRAYPATLRGDQCSSSDAGGFPIAAMLFSADEVARGSIDHAIRFILPNSRMRSGVYVRPATHAGGPSGGAALPPYGVRFRLRSDYPLSSLPSDGARVVARAMQRYGMILSDGGNIALTAQSDSFTAHKWSEVGVDSRSLQAIHVTDVEVVGMGTPITLTYDCVRTP